MNQLTNVLLLAFGRLTTKNDLILLMVTLKTKKSPQNGIYISENMKIIKKFLIESISNSYRSATILSWICLKD